MLYRHELFCTILCIIGSQVQQQRAQDNYLSVAALQSVWREWPHIELLSHIHCPEKNNEKRKLAEKTEELTIDD